MAKTKKAVKKRTNIKATGSGNKTRTASPARNQKEFLPIPELKNVRTGSPRNRLDQTKIAARKFRERMLAGNKVLFYRTFDMIRVPYPTKYGLLNAFSLPTPFMHILNRLFVIQYKNRGKIRTLLFSPSDIYGNRETPYFKRLADSLPFQSITAKLLAPIYGDVEQCLAKTGIKPEQVDYISYDHLHTQDLRKWLGTESNPGYFPNARLVVMKEEWQSVHGLTPPQADWYCPNGTDGIDPAKIIELNSDVELGDGIALVRTPGHTEGNHSLVVHTEDGLFVSSENGVSADSYSPLQSRIAGVRKYARNTGMEVILNGNTLEGGLDQYISMVLEKEIAGPALKNPDFYNVVPSSEMTSYWAFPGVKPTFTFGPLEYGQPVIETTV